MVSGFTILTYKEFAPNDISGLVGWYDATTLSGADGSSLNQWLDSSGNEAHMFQITSAAQPTLQTAELNGRNVVRFDGVDDNFNMSAPFDTLPTAAGNENTTRFSRTGAYLAVFQGGTSPRMIVYKKNANIFNKLTDPAILPATAATSGTWTSDDVYLAVGSVSSPFVNIYKRSGDTFTKLSNPATLPTSAASSLDFSNNDTYLALGGSMTGRMLVYKRAGDTFTALTNPVTVPAGTNANAIKFSRSDNYLAVGSNASPWIQFYSRSGDTFTKLNDPANLPTATVRSISWLSDTVCAVGGNESTVSIYEYNSSTTRFDRINTITTAGTVAGLEYSTNGNFLAIGQGATGFLNVYSQDSNVYTNITTIDRLPTSAVRGVSFNPTDDTLSVTNSVSPFLQTYKVTGSTFSNMNRMNMLRNVSGATVFQVIKYTVSGGDQLGFFASTGTFSSTSRFAANKNTTNNFRHNARALDGDTNILNDSTSTVNGISYYIHAITSNFLTREHRQFANNVLSGSKSGITTAGNTSNTDSLSITLGRIGTGTAFLLGDIAEVIVFNRALSTSELTDMHNYLSVKWGITI